MPATHKRAFIVPRLHWQLKHLVTFMPACPCGDGGVKTFRKLCATGSPCRAPMGWFDETPLAGRYFR
jgi:hypothetical protein